MHVGLKEIEEFWTLADVVRAHQALDAMEYGNAKSCEAS
jgi:hypothetical protein